MVPQTPVSWALGNALPTFPPMAWCLSDPHCSSFTMWSPIHALPSFPSTPLEPYCPLLQPPGPLAALSPPLLPASVSYCPHVPLPVPQYPCLITASCLCTHCPLLAPLPASLILVPQESFRVDHCHAPSLNALSPSHLPSRCSLMPLGPQTPMLSPDSLPSITVHPGNPFCSPVSIPASSLPSGPHSAPSHPLYSRLWAGSEAWCPAVPPGRAMLRPQCCIGWACSPIGSW